MQEGLVRVQKVTRCLAAPILFFATATEIHANTPPPVYYTTDPGYIPALFTSIIATVLWFGSVGGAIFWACRKRDLLGCGQVFAFLTVLFVGTLILIAGGCTQFRAAPTKEEQERFSEAHGGLLLLENGRMSKGPSKATSEPGLILLILVWGGICFSPFIVAWLSAQRKGEPSRVSPEVAPTVELVEEIPDDEPRLPPSRDQPGSGTV